MNATQKRWLVRSVKTIVAVLILVFIGMQFARDLRQSDGDDPDRLVLHDLSVRPGWGVLSAVLYLIGLLPSAWFWWHVQGKLGYPLPFLAAVRAHYIGQLGKYVPGKALAIALRSGLAHPYGVPYGVSIIATFYEVLTGMAAGAIVAAVIFMVDPPPDLGLSWHPAWLGAVLIALCGVPLLPGVFNFVIAKLTARIQAVELYRLPPLRTGTLAIGLLATAVGWWIQGLSWWAMLVAVLPEPPDWSCAFLAQCTASLAFANVAGFVIIVVPGGIGVREFLLRNMLSFAGPVPYIAAAVILFRLLCILTEAIFGLVIFWIKPAPEQKKL